MHDMNLDTQLLMVQEYAATEIEEGLGYFHGPLILGMSDLCNSALSELDSHIADSKTPPVRMNPDR